MHQKESKKKVKMWAISRFNLIKKNYEKTNSEKGL